MPDIDEFQRQRPLLFSIAYRMLGSASDAEDIVQDAWLRYARASERELHVESPKAYLATIVTRLCLDQLKSARATREEYVGPWLPEPVLTEGQPDPERAAATSESLSVAFMVLLETLSPEERATFLLREVFDYSYADIAPIIDSTEANCRQIFHRAKERIAERRPRARQSSGHKRQLVGRFVNAMRSADGAALTSLLAEDVGFWGDGGGKVIASRRPVLGRDQVVRLLVGIIRTAPAAGVALERTSVEIVDVNYEPAMVVRVDGRIDSVYTYSIAGEVITGIRVIRNPDKLAYFARQLAGRTALVPAL